MCCRSCSASLGPHVLLDQANGETQKTMHLPHPLRIAAGQVVVHRHHVNAAAGEGVEIAGRVAQGLALAGFISAIWPSCRTMPPINCTS